MEQPALKRDYVILGQVLRILAVPVHSILINRNFLGEIGSIESCNLFWLGVGVKDAAN